MAKKNKQDKDFQEFPQDSDAPVMDEEPIDEEEEGEEKETEDVYAEDEGDKEIMRKLEEEDRRLALEYFSFDEEVGFNPMFDWSTCPEADRDHFRDLMNGEASEVQKVSWKKLNAFQRWCLARAASYHGLHDMFREIALSIIKVKKQPAELCVADIFLELIWDYLEGGLVKEAVDTLDLFEKSFPEEDAVVCRVRGLIHIYNGELDEGKKCIDELIKLPFNRHVEGHSDEKVSRDADNRDGVVQYEIGYALLNMKRYDQALYYFDRAHNLANMNDDFELIMSIENARATTIKSMNGDE